MKLLLLHILNSKSSKVKIESKHNDLFTIMNLFLPRKIVDRLGNKVYAKLFGMYIRRKVLEGKNEEVAFVMSKEMSKFSLDKYFKKIFNSKDIIAQNTIKENSLRYLENEHRNSKIVIICNDIEEKILRGYIERFKEIVIFSLNKVRLVNMVKKLSYEYGVSIDIIGVDFDSYILADIAVYFDDIYASSIVKAKKNYFFTDDILDKYSIESGILNKYEGEILELDSFPKRKLALAITYLHNFYK